MHFFCIWEADVFFILVHIFLSKRNLFFFWRFLKGIRFQKLSDLKKKKQELSSSYGALLRCQRTKLGFSVHQVAQSLHVPKELIHCIENSHACNKWSVSFVRDAIRLYSHWLGMDKTLIRQHLVSESWVMPRPAFRTHCVPTLIGREMTAFFRLGLSILSFFGCSFLFLCAMTFSSLSEEETSWSVQEVLQNCGSEKLLRKKESAQESICQKKTAKEA